MRPGRALSAAAAAALAAWLGAGPAAAVEADVVVMQGLDKITARTSTFEAPVGETVSFGTLRITPRFCERTPPEEPPERTAFLKIVDQRPDQAAVEVFSGWMFASSPALSALEHPVYDVWVVDCTVTQTAASEDGSEAAQARPGAEGAE